MYPRKERANSVAAPVFFPYGGRGKAWPTQAWAAGYLLGQSARVAVKSYRWSRGQDWAR